MKVRIPQASEYFFVPLAAEVLRKDSALDIILNTTTARYLVVPYYYSVMANGTALLVWLVTGWTFRSSNPGGSEIFRIRLDQARAQWWPGLFLGGKADGASSWPPLPT